MLFPPLLTVTKCHHMRKHTIHIYTSQHFKEHEELKAVHNKALNCSTYFIPLRCIILKTMVAFIKKRIKKSTISAMNLCASEGIMNSRPATERVDITQILLHLHKVNTIT